MEPVSEKLHDIWTRHHCGRSVESGTFILQYTLPTQLQCQRQQPQINGMMTMSPVIPLNNGISLELNSVPNIARFGSPSRTIAFVIMHTLATESCHQFCRLKSALQIYETNQLTTVAERLNWFGNKLVFVLNGSCPIRTFSRLRTVRLVTGRPMYSCPHLMLTAYLGRALHTGCVMTYIRQRSFWPFCTFSNQHL
jgi:hypothetical protein